MFRHSLLFLVMALIATIEFIGDFTVIVVPGWHTELGPPFIIYSIIILTWLYLLSIGYFVLERKNRQPPQKLVIIHLLLTLMYFLYSNAAYSLYINVSIRLIALGLFGAGQLLFIVFFMKNISRSRK